jgi:hypothetical protein
MAEGNGIIQWPGGKQAGNAKFHSFKWVIRKKLKEKREKAFKGYFLQKNVIRFCVKCKRIILTFTTDYMDLHRSEFII